MKLLTILSPLAFVLICGPAFAVDVVLPETQLVHYSIDAGNEFAPTGFAGGLAASAIGTGTSFADLEAGGSLPGSVYLNPTIDSATAAAARANGQFFEFTLSSAGTYLFQPDELTFSVGNGGSSTRGWAIYSSVDGFADVLAAADISTPGPGLEAVSVPLNGFDLASDPVTFRFYVYSPSAGQGAYFDDISVNGLVTIPEPSTLAFAGSLAAAALVRRRRVPA